MQFYKKCLLTLCFHQADQLVNPFVITVVGSMPFDNYFSKQFAYVSQMGRCDIYLYTLKGSVLTGVLSLSSVLSFNNT